MDIENLAQKIIHTIEDKKITPRPRWKFLLKNYSLWTLFGIATVIGSLAVSIIIFLLRHNEWEYLPHNNIWITMFSIIPLFWVIVLIIFVALASYNIRHTNKG